MSTHRTEQDPKVVLTLPLLGDADGVLCTGDACWVPQQQPDDDAPASSTT